MRGVTSIKTHGNLCSPNCGCHAVSVVDTVNSLWQRSFVGKFLINKHVFGVSGLASGLNLIKPELLVCQVVMPGIPSTNNPVKVLGPLPSTLTTGVIVLFLIILVHVNYN